MRNLAGFLKASFANKVEIKGPCFAAAASFAQQIKSLVRSLVAAHRTKMRQRFALFITCQYRTALKTVLQPVL